MNWVENFFFGVARELQNARRVADEKNHDDGATRIYCLQNVPISHLFWHQYYVTFHKFKRYLRCNHIYELEYYYLRYIGE